MGWVVILTYKQTRGCQMSEDAGFDNEPFEWFDVEFESDTFG
jgi:hypothetical protein